MSLPRCSTPLLPEDTQLIDPPCEKCEKDYKIFIDGLQRPVNLKRICVRGGTKLFYMGVISGHFMYENDKKYTDLEIFDAYVNRLIAHAESI